MKWSRSFNIQKLGSANIWTTVFSTGSEDEAVGRAGDLEKEGAGLYRVVEVKRRVVWLGGEEEVAE